MQENPGYRKYMKSASWHRRRNRRIQASGVRCEYEDNRGHRCHERGRLHVHHLHYDTFGRERKKDLQVLCEDHHAVAELRKQMCSQCGKPVFLDDKTAMQHWRQTRNRLPKEWSEALSMAVNTRPICDACIT